MKFIRGLAIIPFLLLVALSQDENPRQSVLESKGNLELSKLFNEAPALPVEDKDVEIYRATFLPTFNNPIKIRVEKRKNTITMTAKQLSGQGGYDPGELTTEKYRQLSISQWKHLMALLEVADFWKLEYVEKKQEPNEKGEVSFVSTAPSG